MEGGDAVAAEVVAARSLLPCHHHPQSDTGRCRAEAGADGGAGELSGGHQARLAPLLLESHQGHIWLWQQCGWNLLIFIVDRCEKMADDDGFQARSVCVFTC